MKTALDFYARGKQKEANADEYDRSRYYSRDRFICPECGEPMKKRSGRYGEFWGCMGYPLYRHTERLV